MFNVQCSVIWVNLFQQNNELGAADQQYKKRRVGGWYSPSLAPFVCRKREDVGPEANLQANRVGSSAKPNEKPTELA